MFPTFIFLVIVVIIIAGAMILTGVVVPRTCLVSIYVRKAFIHFVPPMFITAPEATCVAYRIYAVNKSTRWWRKDQMNRAAC